MNTLEAAKAFAEESKGLTGQDLWDKAAELPKEVQDAYWKLRKARHFAPENAGKATEHLSPSGKYKLVVTSFSTGKGSWNYTQGQVFAQGSDTPIATVQRNYSSFPFLFIEDHPKGAFLVAGEDYQGQTVVELATGRRRDELPEAAKKGHGFCWTDSVWVPSRGVLLVCGCYWACPYEYRFYDFTDPMNGWPHIGEDVCIDEDPRQPEFTIHGDIRVFQTEYTDDDSEEEKLGPIAAWTIYRREGLKLTEIEAWVSDKEKARRQRNKEAEDRYEKWYADFKAGDPLYLAMVEGLKDPVFKPADYNSIGVTYDRWCPDFKKEEKRICRRIHDKGKSKTGYTIDLEWGAETGPVKLVIFKDGQSAGDKFFMVHSVESMQQAFAYARSLL